MSESLAPDPKPSCCISSPQGTCEQHATFSEQELRIMELEDANRELGRQLSIWRGMALEARSELEVIGVNDDGSCADAEPAIRALRVLNGLPAGGEVLS